MHCSVAGSFACAVDVAKGDADFTTRWRLIKAGLSRRTVKTERINASRVKKGERGIRQRRYWEYLIRDERDYEKHMNYVHYMLSKPRLRMALFVIDTSRRDDEYGLGRGRQRE